MKSGEYALGVDIGGTLVKCAAVDADGHVRALRSAASADADGPPAWPGAVSRLVAELEAAQGRRARALAVAAPGLAAADGRSIAHMPGRLQGLEGFDWSAHLAAERAVPVLNDAHAAMLAEAWVGAAAGARDAILITLGTGVGGALWIDGRLHTGCIGRGGHLGHMCLDPDAEPGITGLPGTLEQAIGECTLAARSRGAFATTRELVAAARRGDELAARVWSRSVRVLGCAVASLVNALDPEVVVIGGGIAEAGAALFDPLASELDALEWRPGGQRVAVRAAALGAGAGAIGAARRAWLEVGEACA